ncbi:MAG: T9SS type A sorting domain-containing protein [Thermoproteota archaeon]|nr:T9SS type A sorting domain-containing protein [Thermoproteota archaeon]
MYAVSPEKTSKPKKMNKNSTLKGKSIMILAIFTLLSSFNVNAGNGNGKKKVPKFDFSNPKLVSGTDGQIGAKYFFKNVYANKDAYITIENIVGGAVLKNIDNTTTGYPEAWQPTVGGPGTYGISYIKWDVEFDSADVPYLFSLLDLSAIDVDGDNARVRELSGIVGSNINYSLPDSLTPSLLTLSSTKDIDNRWGTDDDDSVFMALGPVANRAGIDTLALDVRIDYTFANRSSFQIYTGSQVDNNGNTSGIATDRFHSIYFGDLTGRYSVLPVSYLAFNAALNNNAVNLSWSVNAEFKNNRFEVDRSFDQINFSTSAIVLGAQSIKYGVHQYSFVDKDKEILNHDVVYYRLKQLDVNGNFTYSVVKMVRIATITRAFVQISPNPFMDKLNVNFVSAANGNAEVRLIKASGELVKIIAAPITKGYNNVQLLDLNSQASGLYVANIIVNHKIVASLKVIKQ